MRPHVKRAIGGRCKEIAPVSFTASQTMSKTLGGSALFRDRLSKPSIILGKRCKAKRISSGTSPGGRGQCPRVLFASLGTVG
jgi:hypothetical protein